MEYKFKGRTYDIKKVHNRMYFEEVIKSKIAELEDNLIIKNAGMTVYKPASSNELSKGCLALNSGTVLELNLGNRCNCMCDFCPQAKDESTLNAWSHERSIVGHWIDDIKNYIDLFGDKLEAVSFSGGEPLKNLKKLLEIAEFISLTRPNIYQFVYTNGLLISKSKLVKMKKAGINEIRVNLAASKFSEDVISNLKLIKEIIGNVVVEIPSTQKTYSALVEGGLLGRLVELGVTNINLQELRLMQDCNFQEYAVGNEIYEYSNEYGFIVSPCSSRVITLSIIEYAIQNNIDICINDCSNSSKHLQDIMKESLPRYFK